MARAGEHPNPGKNLAVVPIDQPEFSLRIASQQVQDIFGIDAAVLPSPLPRRSSVVSVFLFLDPESGIWKQVDTSHMVPMGMGNDDIGDLAGFNPREANRRIRTDVVRDFILLDPLLPIKTGIQEDVASLSPDQPEHESDV